MEAYRDAAIAASADTRHAYARLRRSDMLRARYAMLRRLPPLARRYGCSICR